MAIVKTLQSGMTMDKRMTINGASADVLSDEWIALFASTRTVGSKVAVSQRAEPIKAAERKALLAQAEAEGFDRVVIERHIYAAYDLRCTMKRRSGTKVFCSEITQKPQGWVEVRSTRSSFY